MAARSSCASLVTAAVYPRPGGLRAPAMGEDEGVSGPSRPGHSPCREKAKRSLPISLLVLLGIIAMYLPLPRRFVAFVPLGIAAYLSVRLLQYLRGRPGRDKVWPVLTLVLIGLIALSLGLQGLFYPSVHAYEECVAAAQTQQATAGCEQLRQLGPIGVGFVLP